MKWSSFYLVLLFTVQILSSCSNDPDKDESASTSSATSTETTTTPGPASEAKEKKPDAVVQGLKGKVQVMSETVYPPEGSKKSASKNVFKYDENGNRIELLNYRPGGELNSTLRSIYDGNGKLVKEETILGNGTIDNTSQIKTDAKGNKIEQQDTRTKTGTNVFNYKYYYKYNEKGAEVERIAYRGNGTFLFKYSFAYDANGNKTEWIQSVSDSTVMRRVVYKYDDNNNLVEESEYGRGNTLKATYTYSYEFDKKKNWIRQTKMQNNSVVQIKEREITYK